MSFSGNNIEPFINYNKYWRFNYDNYIKNVKI
jgi:hypothetical protein